MLANTLMVVLTHPQDAAREKEFNQWYSGNHVPDVLNAPYWREAVRYKLAKATVGDIPPYLALYQVDTDDAAAANAALRRYLDTTNPWWRLPNPPATPPASGVLVTLDFWSYWRKTLEVGHNDQSPAGAPKAVMVTLTRPAKAAPVQPLNEWYDGHVGDIIKTPGFRGAARYELAKMNVGYIAPYLAVYELDTDDVEQVDRDLQRYRDLWLAGDKRSSYYASTGPMPTTEYGERWIQADGFAYFTLVDAPTKTPTLTPK